MEHLECGQYLGQYSSNRSSRAGTKCQDEHAGSGKPGRRYLRRPAPARLASTAGTSPPAHVVPHHPSPPLPAPAPGPRCRITTRPPLRPTRLCRPATTSASTGTTSPSKAPQSSARRTRRVPTPRHLPSFPHPPLPVRPASPCRRIWLASTAAPPLSPRAPPPAASRPQVPAKVTSVSTEGFTAEMLFFQPPSSLVPRDFDYLFDDPDWERLEIGEMSERQRLKCVPLPAAVPTLLPLHALAHTHTHTHTHTHMHTAHAQTQRCLGLTACCLAPGPTGSRHPTRRRHGPTTRRLTRPPTRAQVPLRRAQAFCRPCQPAAGADEPRPHRVG